MQDGWVLRSLGAVVFVLSGCSGGGGGGGGRVGNGDLSTGEYEASNTRLHADSCVVTPDFDGEILYFDIAGTDLRIDDDFEGVYEDGVFDAESDRYLDFTVDPFGLGERECLVEIVETLSGVTTDVDSADVDYTFKVRIVEGNECHEAAADLDPLLDFPCSSSADFQIALPPPPPPGTLQSGYYAFSNAAVSPDGCGFGSANSFYGQYGGADVLVSATELQVDLFDFVLYYDITGTDLYDFSSPGATTFDFNDVTVATDNGLAMTYDCVVTASIEYVGSISTAASNQFRLEDHYDYTGSGTECAAVATSVGLAAIPCSSVDGTDAILQ